MKMVEKNDTKCFVYQQGNPYLQIAGFLMPAFFGRRQEQETTFHHITVANVIISQKYQNWSKYHTHYTVTLHRDSSARKRLDPQDQIT